MVTTLKLYNTETIETLSNSELKSVLNSTEQADRNKQLAFRQLRIKQTNDLTELALKVLRNKKADRDLKSEVVNYLEQSGKHEGLKALSKQLLKEDDLAVKSQIIRILGERGDEDDLAILKQIDDPKSENAMRFIAYRFGNTAYLWPQSRLVENTRSANKFKIVTRQLSEAEDESIIEENISPIPVHPIGDIEIKCQNQVFHLHRSKDFVKNENWNELVKKPQIMYQFFAKHYSAPMLSHYLMIHPGKDSEQFHINVVTPSGRQIYSGVGKLQNGNVSFSLATVANAKVPPIKVKGEYSLRTNEYKFIEALSSINVKNGERRVPSAEN